MVQPHSGGWRDNCPRHHQLTAETTSEEDSIEWLDFGTEDDAPVGGTITGTVVTPDGSSVPRATIIAQTTDNLLRKETRSYQVRRFLQPQQAPQR